MINKGRHATGEKSKRLFTNEQRAEIRLMYASGNYSQLDLAKLFGTTQQRIWAIVRYKSRKSLTSIE